MVIYPIDRTNITASAPPFLPLLIPIWVSVSSLPIPFDIVIANHSYIECSRRDDLESLAYMLIYFMRGTLPWRKLKGQTTSETWDLIKSKKLETAPLLTVGLPPEFEVFYKYVRGLEFGDLPDYEGLRGLLRGLADREGIEYDGGFEWVQGTAGPTGGRRSARVVGEEGRERKKRRFCRACDACEERERERVREKERRGPRSKSMPRW